MSVYRELASELRANKAVIDSLNSRNQQLIRQNQFLKQEIHNVVQSALSLGQAAGIARPAHHLTGSVGEVADGMPHSSPTYNPSSEFSTPLAEPYIPERIAPETLARLAHSETSAAPSDRAYDRAYDQPIDRPSNPESLQNRVPSPIVSATQKISKQTNAKADKQKGIGKKVAKLKADKTTARSKAVSAKAQAARPQNTRSQNARPQTSAAVGRQTEDVTIKQSKLSKSLPKPKLFTEQSGSFRSSAIEAQESKEISGIWLVLSIILIVVTAFGAGFLIMKPLLNER